MGTEVDGCGSRVVDALGATAKRMIELSTAAQSVFQHRAN